MCPNTTPADFTPERKRKLSSEELLRTQLVFVFGLEAWTSPVLTEGTLPECTSNETFRQRREHTVIHQPPKHTYSQTLQRFESKPFRLFLLYPTCSLTTCVSRAYRMWSVSINNLRMVNAKWSVSVISEMLQALRSLSPAVDYMTHLQAHIDISVLNELTGTKMDP